MFIWRLISDNFDYLKGPLIFVAGIAVLFAISTPKTAATAEAFLTRRGYAHIKFDGPAQSCGSRGQRGYSFRATQSSGERVSGLICMGDFPPYRITIETRD